MLGASEGRFSGIEAACVDSQHGAPTPPPNPFPLSVLSMHFSGKCAGEFGCRKVYLIEHPTAIETENGPAHQARAHLPVVFVSLSILANFSGNAAQQSNRVDLKADDECFNRGDVSRARTLHPFGAV